MPKTVKIENCPNLVDVNLSDQRVKNLEIENCPKINTIMCDNHKLSSLNLNLPLLEELDCSYGRTLKELDLSHLPALKTLNCSGALRAAKFLLHNSAAQGRMHYCKPKEK